MAASREFLAVQTLHDVAIFDPDTGKQLRSVEFPKVDNDNSNVYGVTIDRSGRRLAMVTSSLRVTVVEMNSLRHVWTSNLRPDHSSGSPIFLSFSPDGRSLAAAGGRVFLVVNGHWRGDRGLDAQIVP
jgi:hypothetical protein